MLTFRALVFKFGTFLKITVFQGIGLIYSEQLEDYEVSQKRDKLKNVYDCVLDSVPG